MTIGELAKSAGTTVQTIRYYEREGLLPRAHRWRDNNYRDFDEAAVRRLRFIRAAKELGFTLREIKQLLDLNVLPTEACGEVAQMIAAKLDDLDQRLAELCSLRRDLRELLTACNASDTGEPCAALRRIGG